MSHIKGIEHLPQDAIREIMTLVAAQSGGATNIARAFSVCKTLRYFANDGDVLKAVSFDDFISYLPAQYEQLLEVDGLVARCSKAGNSDAKFILSKVVLGSASLLCNTKMAVSESDESVDRHRNLGKAARLLDHLSAENADHIDLARNFLSKAKFQEFTAMQCHVKNFMVLYLVPEKKPQVQQFLTELDKLCNVESFPLQRVTDSDPLTFMIGKFNYLCEIGHDTMKESGINEEVLCPILQSLVQSNDDVDYNTLLERLNVVEPILMGGGGVASNQGNVDARVINGTVLCIAAMLRGYLMLLIDHDACVERSRKSLLKTFDFIYDIEHKYT